MKTVFLILFGFGIMNAAFADDFDYDSYDSYYADDAALDDSAIETTDGENSCQVSSVAINSDASPMAVGNFDIAGIMLGMTFEDAQLIVRENGLYALRPKDSIVYNIHQDWKYNLDYECRQQKVYAPEKLERCIRSLARARGLLYAGELHLVREYTGETIDVYFTSNATDNLVWKIVYNNDVADVEGDAAKFDNQKNKKILKWWQGVLDKYGAPNSDSDKWVSSDNAYDPMMTAYYGRLELTDCGRFSDDDSRNLTAAADNFAAKPYAF